MMETFIADINAVRILLDSDLETSVISDKTGIRESEVERYRDTEGLIDSMELSTAIALTRFAENQIAVQSGEFLNWMKHRKGELDYVVRLNKANNRYLRNRDTRNLQGIYSFRDDEHGHFYGAYGDAVGGQIDSRDVSDEKIKEAIIKLLRLGNMVPRSECTEKLF